MKTCSTCGLSKSEDQFYVRHWKQKTYRSAQCSACKRAATKRWKKTPAGKRSMILGYRTYHKKHRPELLEKYKEYRRLNPEVIRRYGRTRDKAKKNAGQKLRYAVRTGKMRRAESCSHCGELCVTQAHHPDYSKPLQVVWLCSECHGKQHRIELEAK